MIMLRQFCRRKDNEPLIGLSTSCETRRWQRQRVYPDLLACLHGTEGGMYRFSVLETKGEHLKGNDDTEYKKKLFELLTGYADTAIKAGELDLGEASQQMSFTMLMEDSWALAWRR